MDAPLSLLWPAGSRPARTGPGRLSPAAMRDLDLDELLLALAGGEPRRVGFARAVLAGLCPDQVTIAYRAEALTALLEQDALREGLQRALPGLTALLEAPGPRPEEWVVQQVIDRLTELTLYSEVAVQLRETLDAAPTNATAWQALHAALRATTNTAAFLALRTELPALRAALAEAGSVTVGVNLGADLQPDSAAILSLSKEKVGGRSPLLERLFGGDGSVRSITPLRAVQAAPLGRDTPLARDLRALLERVVDPVRLALDRYLSIHTRALQALEPELAFLLHGAALVLRLRRAGLPCCRPQYAPAGERVCTLSESYNVALALRLLPGTSDAPLAATLVTNPVLFDQTQGRVWILTGPNRGGKTIYTRGVGLAQVLFQAGLYVPAGTARLSPVDAIYTHFPAPEQAVPGRGHLDEEAARLADIFQQARPQSLILLNEALAGTNSTEALGLAMDIVRGLRLLGARAIYVTHLHELAARSSEINAHTPGDGTVGSLVSEVEAGSADGRERRTFRIRPGAPRSASYASAIAEQQGISFPQLASLLQRRGIVPHDCAEGTGGAEA